MVKRSTFVETNQYNLYLPAGYGKKKLPVLYLLHGSCANHRLWMGKGYIKRIDIRAMLDNLMDRELIRPMIVVMPNGGSSFYSGDKEKYLIEELVPTIDRLYKTTGRRMIAGHSMGGYGAMKLALKYANQFHAVYSMNGILSLETAFLKRPYRQKLLENARKAWSPDTDLPWTEKNGTRKKIHSLWKTWAAQDPLCMLRDEHKKLAIAFDAAEKEQLLNANQAFAATLEKRGVDYKFTVHSGGHTTDLAVRLETVVLPWISSVSEDAPGVRKP